MTLGHPAPGATPAVPPPHPRRWAGLAVLCASLLIVTMDMTILNVALPEISADLRPSSVQLLWMVDVYSLVVAGLLVTVAALGDRWGRKRMLVLGFSIFGLASVGVLFVDSPGGVIAIRALLGVGGAMIMPSTLSMIRHLFTEPRERATALGVWATMAALGSALGPVVGGALLEAFSWHSAFLFNVPVMVVAVVAALFLLPESRSPRPGRRDLLSTALIIVGMVTLVYAIKHFGKDGLAHPETWVPGIVAAVTLTWFVRRSLTQRDPMLEVRLFKGRAFTAGTVGALTASLAIAATLLLLAQWMQLVQGYSPLATGVRLLPMAVAAAIVSPLSPALAMRVGARTVLAGGLAVSGVGFMVLFLGPQPLDYPLVAVSLVLVGAGLGSLAIASAVIMAGAPAAKSGSAAAIEETSYEVGATLGVAVLGSIAAAQFRSALNPGELTADGVHGPAVDAARESLAGALEVAHRLGDAGSGLAATARAAFTDSLETAGLAGGLLMLAAAALVWFLTPRELSIADAEH
ncbi:MFS transporter [Actinomadura flavalba]|uniref:MFS transporter n=1 Tax=Actinomadura flavalba TaxID=1120938 RepID=UPI0003691AC7|nr:MFS transporter [Actinomadura flavalba]